MNTGLLRLIWSVIEETPTSHFKEKGDRDQVMTLLCRIENQVTLSHQERIQVQRYLADHTPLIHDICLEQVI